MTLPARRALAIGLALAIDRRLGELPTAVHPVGLVGRAAHKLRRRAPADPRGRLRFGAVTAGVLPTGAALGYWCTARLAGRNPLLSVMAEAGLLSTTVSLGALLRRTEEVERALEAGDLEQARRLTAWHLVSRDTSALDASGVAAAAIESLAENLSDGVVAPLLAYALGGLPAAAFYRAANTLDSLWGYRTPELAELGRHPARLDDALNLVPSRATAAAVVVAAALLGRRGYAPWRALDTWLAEGDFTPSPNAGQPMGAMAGALGVELRKEGEYRLGSGLPRPTAKDIARARRLASLAAALAVGSIVVALLANAVRASSDRRG